MHKFNICDTTTLGHHFHPDMFWLHIYDHHQGKRVCTKSWDATGEMKSFLLCMHCQSHSTETDVHRAWPALYTQCEGEGEFHSAYTAPAVLYGRPSLWSDSDNVYIT
jgi:hypothetical protein